MNKLIILLPISVLLSGAAGFFAAKKIYEVKYAQIAQEEIDSVKEVFDRRLEEYTAEIKEVMSIKEKKIEEAVKPVKLVQKASTRGIEDTPQKVCYNDYERAKQEYRFRDVVKEEDIPTEDTDEPEDDEVKDAAGYSESDYQELARVDRTQPYVISDTEFSEEHSDYDKVSLCYYRVDDVLCEENEQIIDDIDGSVGYEALELLDTQTSAWVRNEPLGIDYEIISLNRSYAEATGIIKKVMTPRERYLSERRDKNVE